MKEKTVSAVSYVADVMVLSGAIFLTIGTDVMIATAGVIGSPIQPLGTVISVLGTTLLASGLIVNRRRRHMRAEQDGRSRE